jgi:cyclic-di-GMP-binding protein
MLILGGTQRRTFPVKAIQHCRLGKERIPKMAGECSFDIVSQFDEQELVNAIDQARREVQTRYDLKDTKTEIIHNKDSITIVTDGSLTLKNVRDILETKAVRRHLSLKVFKPGKEEDAAGGRIRQVIQLQQGISQELAKEISKYIRETYPKVRPQVQGDAIRVTAKSRDELQAVIALLKQKDYPVPLQYINYRP